MKPAEKVDDTYLISRKTKIGVLKNE